MEMTFILLFQKRKLVGLILFAVFLQSCSQVNFLYSLADDIVESRTRSLLDISDPEDGLHLEETITSLFAQNTPTFSKDVGLFLRNQADRLEQVEGSPPETIFNNGVYECRRLLRSMSVTASPYVAEVLFRHSDEKGIDYLENSLAELREDKMKEYSSLSTNELREERVKKVVRSVERFIPDLTNGQLKVVAAHVDEEIAQNLRARWLLNSERKHISLIAFLRTKPSEAEISEFIWKWFAESWRVADPSYKEYSQAWWDSKANLLWRLCLQLSGDQKMRVVETLRSYADDIEALSS